MNLKIGKILESLISESKKDIKIKKLLSPLKIENGNVKLWHYSKKLIEDDFISTRGEQGLHSRNEFKTWGKSRAFFYGTKNGVGHDRGVPRDYMYIAHMPIDDIYPIMINPNEYKVPKGEHFWQSMYEQASKDGYKAFIYNLGGEEGVPIIVSFVDVPIDEKYVLTSGGKYKNLDEKQIDYPIGKFIDEDGVEWTIMQKDGYKRSLINTYLTQEDSPEEAMDSYKRQFHVYEWKNADLFPKYEFDYLQDVKKS